MVLHKKVYYLDALHNTHFITVAADAHEKVIGLDVAMNEGLAVDIFDSADHLVRQHQDRFDREAARTEVEQVLERRPQEVHDEHVVVAFLAVPPGGQKNRKGLI